MTNDHDKIKETYLQWLREKESFKDMANPPIDPRYIRLATLAYLAGAAEQRENTVRALNGAAADLMSKNRDAALVLMDAADALEDSDLSIREQEGEG